MNIISKYIFLLLIFNSFHSFAQTNPSQVISTSGGTISNTDYIMSFTIGELAIDDIGYGVRFTQGFHQGNLSITSSIEEIDFITNIYPNPSLSYFTIEFSSPQKIQLFLRDNTGKIIIHDKIENQTIKSYDVSSLAQGNYLLILLDKNENKSTLIN
ncbi:T9SS type A sorting domain-containing protein [Flavobacteriales bacterium]|nr:T9SS type A sorting domain-containing protein [Flavobacteriales bacterium]